jgi:hypothetical protein
MKKGLVGMLKIWAGLAIVPALVFILHVLVELSSEKSVAIGIAVLAFIVVSVIGYIGGRDS